MKRNDILMLMTAAMIALGTGATAAQDRADRGQISFAELDVDGDGEITDADLTAAREARFADLDTDGNGSVSRDEFIASASTRAGERAGEMFDRLDADGDGALSEDVLASRDRGPGPRMLQRLDADGSGGVSEAEFEEARERMGERRGFMRGHGERRGG